MPQGNSRINSRVRRRGSWIKTHSLIPAFSPRRRRIVLRLTEIHAAGFFRRYLHNRNATTAVPFPSLSRLLTSSPTLVMPELSRRGGTFLTRLLPEGRRELFQERKVPRPRSSRSVLDCGSPLPLSERVACDKRVFDSHFSHKPTRKRQRTGALQDLAESPAVSILAKRLGLSTLRSIATEHGR